MFSKAHAWWGSWTIEHKGTHATWKTTRICTITSSTEKGSPSPYNLNCALMHACSVNFNYYIIHGKASQAGSN
jgi:hypothetical protein